MNTVAGVLRRAAAMDRREIAFRTRQTARIAGQRILFGVRRPEWRRASLAKGLGHDRALHPARNALRAGAWSDAHRTLRHVMLARRSRFVLDPLRRDEVAGQVSAGAALTVPDRVLGGEYDLLGYERLRCADERGRIDWHRDAVSGRRAPDRHWASIPYLDPNHGDHKVIWELNRHQHWLALGRAAWLTGDRRYRDEIVRQLRSWLAANPPLTGMNWSSMLELSLRAISWVWALHFLLALDDEDDADWIVDLLLGLDRQLDHVCDNLSYYFSPNTHLTGEALGLYVAGCALPELKAADRWTDVGRRTLLAEIDRQILPDGGHAERSMYYHRYTLDFYVLACATARRAGDPAAAVFADAVERLATFARHVADAAGRLPRFGDDDGGMLLPICGRDPADASDALWMAAHMLDRPELAVGPMPEEAVWMGLSGAMGALGARGAKGALGAKGAEGTLGAEITPRSVLLAETGYVVSRGPRHHIVIDAGPHGFLKGGHSHADALSMVATFDGVPFLIDTGTATYTADPVLRDRFRSSQMHNTLTLDDRSQSEPAGPFSWRRTATGSTVRWAANAAFDAFDGTHDGYVPASHRRFIFVLPAGTVVVADAVVDDAPHRAAVHWHADPAWHAETFGRAFRFRHDRGHMMWLVPIADSAEVAIGDQETGLGLTSPAYGRVIPCTTVRLRASAAPVWIVSAFAAGADVPVLEELDRGPGHIAIRLRHGDATDWFSFAIAPPTAVISERRVTHGFATDARMAHVRTDRTGQVTQTSIVDGTFAALEGAIVASSSGDGVEPFLAGGVAPAIRMADVRGGHERIR